MYFELALISVAIGGAYWGWQFVRQQSLRFYGALNLLAAVLSIIGYAGQRGEESKYGIVGAIGVGAGACLLVLGPFARGLARRAAAAERLGLARRLLDIADVLSPGSGVQDEKMLLAAMQEIRDGNIDKTVDALSHAKHRAPPEAMRSIDERITMLYLASYRWEDAIRHAETHLFDATPPATEAQPTLALRRALGVSPPVWVDLLGAYAYTGDLEQAARMLARLEDVCAGRQDAGIWVHRGRLVFLALAGRVDAVQALVEPRRARHMKPAARIYWIGVAHDRHGDAKDADAAYAKARAKTRGRPRQLIDQAIAKLRSVKPAELGSAASEVVARVEAEPPPVVVDPARPQRRWAVRSLLLTMLAVSFVVSFAIGPSTDIGVLVRNGALVHGLVDDGEWWRLVSAIFIHVGVLHLLNLVGLWLIGRLCEDVFGPWRTLAIFGVAGVAGCAASYWGAQAAITAGASGAMFGLLGAVFIELTLHRKRHRGLPRGMWGSLALVTVAQIAISFMYPFIDQWAHGGGLIAGTLAGLVLSPSVRWARAGQHLARVIAIGFVGVSVYAGVMVARTPVAESLARSPLVKRELAGYTITAPLSWLASKTSVQAPDVFMAVFIQPASAGPVESWLPALADSERKRAKDEGFDQMMVARAPLVPLPAGWQGEEHVVTFSDSLDTRQRYRLVLAGRPEGTGMVTASLYVPETIARWAPSMFTNLLASIRAR